MKYISDLPIAVELFYIHGLTIKQIESKLLNEDYCLEDIESYKDNETVQLSLKAWKMYSGVKSREKKLEEQWPWLGFAKWYLDQDQVCYYCELPQQKVFDYLTYVFENKGHKRMATRGHSLELDRKNYDSIYQESDCVLSCYICNNAKSDVFEAEEFKSIGLFIAKEILKTV